MSESSPQLAETMKLLADIMIICRNNRELCTLANTRLHEIIYSFDKSPEELAAAKHKLRSQKAIEEHIAVVKKTSGVVIRPTSVHYRQIALILAKRNDFEFDPKTTKKKEDIMKWFDKYWDKIRQDVFVLLDQLSQGST